jgi:hypothetical protein
MRSESDGSTPSPNAFAEDFLEVFDRFDEPLTGAEADAAGPWIVLPMVDKPAWGVLRLGEDLDLGDWPTAVFTRRERALLAAAVLPGTGTDLRFRLHLEAGEEGYALEEAGGELAGHFRTFNEDLKTALHVVDGLVRSPLTLSYLLEAAGPLALRHAGLLLRRRIEKSL